LIWTIYIINKANKNRKNKQVNNNYGEQMLVRKLGKADPEKNYYTPEEYNVLASNYASQVYTRQKDFKSPKRIIRDANNAFRCPYCGTDVEIIAQRLAKKAASERANMSATDIAVANYLRLKIPNPYDYIWSTGLTCDCGKELMCCEKK
jgi:hypothetical protein